MENGTKKTIIWESNSEPPKSYIWIKEDGVAYEYNNLTDTWEMSKLIGSNSEKTLTINTIPEVKGRVQYGETIDDILNLLPTQPSFIVIDPGFDEWKPFIKQAGDKILEMLGITEQDLISLSKNEYGKVLIKGRAGEIMIPFSFYENSKITYPIFNEIPFNKQSYFIKFGTEIEGLFEISFTIDNDQIYIISFSYQWNDYIDFDSYQAFITNIKVEFPQVVIPDEWMYADTEPSILEKNPDLWDMSRPLTCLYNSPQTNGSKILFHNGGDQFSYGSNVDEHNVEINGTTYYYYTQQSL